LKEAVGFGEEEYFNPPKKWTFDIEVSSWFWGRRIFRKYDDVSCLPRK